MMMYVGSLFSGIGGIELGFERQGFKTAWFIELEPFCQAVLRKNFPGIPIYSDIRTTDFNQLPRVDILTGGFPCQDISVAGAGRGIVEGTRSGLWFEYAKVINALRPRIVIIENVSQIITRGLATVIGDLEGLGYCPHAKIIRASDFGAPHRRERLFIVAHSSQERCNDCFNFDSFNEVQVDKEWDSTQNIKSWSGWERWFRENVQDAHWKAPDSSLHRMDDGIPYWVDRIAACGNAVVPQVAELIARAIKEKEA